MRAIALILMLGIASLTTQVPAQVPTPIVAIRSGSVQGIRQGGTIGYLGIPYAMPPVGNLRWQPPKASPRWKGVRQAVAFGHSCPQPGMNARSARGRMAEDCLFLNVWTSASAPAGKAPVMVWIHGGGYVSGSGDLVDTAAFTRDGVILVSINYRLGRLGFFAHPALTAERPSGLLANYGILDQIAALKWVRDNIAAFGGDPKNVTIFGNSAGATFVNFLMVSPRSKGLFTRAIAQSDPFALPWPYMASMNRRTETAEAKGERWASGLGIPHATAAQLRALPVEKTLGDPAKAIAEGVTPIIDGRILPERGPEAFAAGKAKRIPYIIGANSYEGALAVVYREPTDQRVADLGAQGEAILNSYDPRIRNDPALLGATIMGDGGFLAPRRWAARMATAGGTPTWVYHFAYVPERLRAAVPGAPHGLETPFVFEGFNNLTLMGFRPTPADMSMAERVHSFWINFARSGNPNGLDRTDWSQFGAGRETLMLFDNDGVRPVAHFNDKLYDLYQQRLTEQRAGR